MKKYGILRAILALAMVLAFGVVNAQAVVDKTASVSASATVGPVTSMSITAPDPAAISYSTVDADSFQDEGKVVIAYSSNYDPWKIAIYTNNLTVLMRTADEGRYAKGGLANVDDPATPEVEVAGKNVVACKWVCQDDATPAPAIANINVGGPEDTGYNFIKDKRDEDDPADNTGDPVDPAEPDGPKKPKDDSEDQSWDAAFAGGYPNIAVGAPGNAAPYSFCVDPTAGDPFHGDPADGTIAVYIAGMFGTGGMSPAVPASAGVYKSDIGFDLYHE